MRRFLTIAVVPFLLVACSSPTTINPTRNLQYPVDMAMVCLKNNIEPPVGIAPPIEDTTWLSGQPMHVCHERGVADPTFTGVDRRPLGTFAFIINAGTNVVAVADMDVNRLLDLSPKAPGYGMLPVGTNPQAIAASEDGCWVVTANRSSCDLTLIDPASLLAPNFGSTKKTVKAVSGRAESNHQLVVQTGVEKRQLHTAIGEIAFLSAPAAACVAGNQPMAVATFPSCDLVATLSLSFEGSTATIVDSYYVRPDLPGGFLAAGADPVCPSDCGSTTDSGVAALEAGTVAQETVDGGIDAEPASNAPVTTKAVRAFYLQPLAMAPGSSRVYVASLFDSAVTSFDVTPAGLANPSRFKLAESPFGVNRLRLGIDPHRTVRPPGATDPVLDPFLRNRGSFLYAFARDDSVRVVEIGGATPVECDVNVVAHPSQQATGICSVTADLKAKGCFPVGAPDNPPRRPLAQGPGIRIPAFISPDSPPPLPRDLAFAELLPLGGDANYQSLSGQFGFLLASNGMVYVLNLAPIGEDGTTPATGPNLNSSCATNLTAAPPCVPAAATHSFRDNRSVGQCSRVPLSMSVPPLRTPIVSDQPFASAADYATGEGPLIPSFRPAGSTTDSWVDFPDPDGIVSRSWYVTWEDTLPGTSRQSGVVEADGNGQSTWKLTDKGADFCASSVQPGDVMVFSGCSQNSDCQPDDQFSCQAAAGSPRNMCLPIDSAKSTALVTACSDFFGSRMRYEVKEVKQTHLVLGLKLDEVPKTGLNPCQEDRDCQPDLEHGLNLQAPDGGVVTPDGGDKQGFQCLPSKELSQPGVARRCVKSCTQKSDCRAGSVCQSVADIPGVDHLCVEAPPINPACFPRLTMGRSTAPMMARYSVRAGKSFVVTGSSLPTMRTQAALPDGTCKAIPALHPSLVSRISLAAPACPEAFLAPAGTTPDSNHTFVQQLEAQSAYNPCLYRGKEDLRDGSSEPEHIRAFFQNPQIRFVLTNVDQYVGEIFGIHFELQNGFRPLTIQMPTVEILVTMGTRILTGPTKTPESPIRRYAGSTDPAYSISYPYLYVVDQGGTALTPLSHGQVVRINPRAGTNELATFDTAISGSTPFQLQ